MAKANCQRTLQLTPIGVDEERTTSVTPRDQYSQIYGVPVVQRIATTASGRPYLIPTAPLDRELCDLYAFTLIAVDGGDRNAIDVTASNRALTGSVYVVIKVADVNDNRPTFDRPHYEAKIVENFMPANIFTFEVVDKDIGENGRVSISIQDTSRTAEQTFRIISETEMFSLDEASSHGFPSYHSDVIFESALESRGIVASYRQYAIRTKKELDRETRSYYVFTLRVSGDLEAAVCRFNDGDIALGMKALCSNGNL
ncbi:hypothetical protein X801_01005 [Opisthorchis viverrini]|uniref:Cadherin domain-containing protein n=1 Tax=Opisthorchis viverrini TaxID=6198 RepID=A0A1S8X8S1_OPIVI|nr:hypothetical protein X801_01005 [Opisthorchis viverrini]